MDHRAQIVSEARSWIGTPYVIRARVKGAGCDCGSLLMSIGVNAGMIDDFELETYSIDCWQHWSDEKYLRAVMRNTEKVLEGVAYKTTVIRPGCLILTRTPSAKFFNHGAIVTDWPKIVHAVTPQVEEVDATKHWLWAYRPIAAFDFNRVNQ